MRRTGSDVPRGGGGTHRAVSVARWGAGGKVLVTFKLPHVSPW